MSVIEESKSQGIEGDEMESDGWVRPNHTGPSRQREAFGGHLCARKITGEF